jgi:hypothetical protein
MTISQGTVRQGTVRPYIIASLVAHGGEAPGGTVTAEALVAIGADPAVESNRQAVANARHDLKGRGCVTDGRVRGHWAITDAGRAVHGGAPLPPYVRAPKEGKTLVEVLGDAPAVEPETAPAVETAPAPEFAKVTDVAEPAVEVAPEAPVVETVVEAPEAPVVETVVEAPAPAPKRRLKVATPVPAVVVPEWLHDEGLRTLVVENTECFGLWSAKAAGCGECLVAGWCRNAKSSILTMLATKIRTDTPEAPSPVTEVTANLDSEVGKGNAPGTPRTAPNPEAESFVIRATHDTLCGLTGAPIRKGDAVRYVRGTGLVLVK